MMRCQQCSQSLLICSCPLVSSDGRLSYDYASPPSSSSYSGEGTIAWPRMSGDTLREDPSEDSQPTFGTTLSSSSGHHQTSVITTAQQQGPSRSFPPSPASTMTFNWPDHPGSLAGGDYYLVDDPARLAAMSGQKLGLKAKIKRMWRSFKPSPITSQQLQNALTS
ncbi:hypothetical protein H4219_005873 [Mycoemilia scoparia]|uniref:Uncharacterized protein n=1 Tax=Mycoemilia scoparia TaxID=417184 RepID=A0A9W7ZSN5_9FUNG|nr:hypothetical protein H4219_005873 [Mycoemilia scoparia]